MIHRKTAQEIEIMRDGGKRLGIVLDRLLEFAQPGVSLLERDKNASISKLLKNLEIKISRKFSNLGQLKCGINSVLE